MDPAAMDPDLIAAQIDSKNPTRKESRHGSVGLDNRPVLQRRAVA
jgi:hypothetical protein